LDYADRFVVTVPREILLALGDRLQMKFNGKSVEGVTVRNGELATVQHVMKNGCIRIRDDLGVTKTLSPSQRMFMPGYAVTSYASQGKTVDTVLAVYSDERVIANQNQWYVTISRARRQVKIFTEDKEALRLRIDYDGARELVLSINADKNALPQITPIEQSSAAQRLDAEHQRQIALRADNHAPAPPLAPMPGIQPFHVCAQPSLPDLSHQPSTNNRGIKI
jgi:hypothetical protein